MTTPNEHAVRLLEATQAAAVRSPGGIDREAAVALALGWALLGTAQALTRLADLADAVVAKREEAPS